MKYLMQNSLENFAESVENDFLETAKSKWPEQNHISWFL